MFSSNITWIRVQVSVEPNFLLIQKLTYLKMLPKENPKLLTFHNFNFL